MEVQKNCVRGEDVFWGRIVVRGRKGGRDRRRRRCQRVLRRPYRIHCGTHSKRENVREIERGRAAGELWGVVGCVGRADIPGRRLDG